MNSIEISAPERSPLNNFHICSPFNVTGLFNLVRNRSAISFDSFIFCACFSSVEFITLINKTKLKRIIHFSKNVINKISSLAECILFYLKYLDEHPSVNRQPTALIHTEAGKHSEF